MWMSRNFACCGSKGDCGDATITNQSTMIDKLDALLARLEEHDIEIQSDLDDDDIIIY